MVVGSAFLRKRDFSFFSALNHGRRVKFHEKSEISFFSRLFMAVGSNFTKKRILGFSAKLMAVGSNLTKNGTSVFFTLNHGRQVSFHEKT
jgi:hypothetical protein